MKIYTKKGDDGDTGVLGPDRVSKDDVRIQAYGAVDELNSLLGIVITTVDQQLAAWLVDIQALLFEIGGDLASVQPRNRINAADIQALEVKIDELDAQLPTLTSFILPGGGTAARWLHLARATTRRVEREVVTLSNKAEINPFIIPFLNRLSDLLFTMARYSNHANDIHDLEWKPRDL